MKGVSMMCDHKRLRTEGDRVFCVDCGEELPLDFLYGIPEEPPAADPDPESVDTQADPVNDPEEPEATLEPAQESQDGPGKATDEQKAGKSPEKGTKAKTAGKTAKKGGNE